MKKLYFSPLYHELKSKFFKYCSRLQKSIKSGKFSKLSNSERKTLLQRIEKLRARLMAINPKFAIAGAALFLATSGAMAQPFAQQGGALNPAQSVILASPGYGAPEFGDLDNDGDMDMIVGDYSSIQYWKNTGTASAPVFTQQTGVNNPFDPFLALFGSYGYTVPTLGDIDNDGDLDLLTGHNGDTIFYFKNTGTTTVPAYTQQTGVNNIIPDFPDTTYLDEVAPRFVDIDNDGDLDVFIGEEDHTAIFYLRNTGTASVPNMVYESQYSANNPCVTINPTMTGYRAEAGVGDVDADGDYDLLVGHSGGALQYFKNTGTAAAPVFTEQMGVNNPFNAIVPNGYFYSAFVDIDGDTDYDMFVGAGDSVRYYKNVNPTTQITENNFSKEFSLYPNPATSTINVNVEGRYAIRITDVAGQVVLQQNLTEKVINIESLKAGVYVVEVTQANNRAVRSLVVE